jgi:flagellar hook-associated protein 3 FlgL
MRVSTQSFNNNYLFQLNQLGSQQNQLQAQAASGLKVALPEDNPAVMGEVLNQQAQAQAGTQYQSNIAQLQGTATATSALINGLNTISSQASQIATQVGGLSSSQDLSTYVTQVNALISQAIDTANTQNQGSYLLGGTQTTSPPYVATTDSNGNVTAVTFQGNSSVAKSEIAPGVTLSAQTLGANTTGSGPEGLITDSRSGADFINHLIQLRNNLQSGNTSAVTSQDLPNLAKDQDNLSSQVAANGVVQSQLQTAGTVASQATLNLNSQVSTETNADLAQVLTQLSQAQNAYIAALESGSKLMNISLVNFLT